MSEQIFKANGFGGSPVRENCTPGSEGGREGNLSGLPTK